MRKMSQETKKKISEAMKKKKKEVVLQGLNITLEIADTQGRTIELKFENGILTGKV